MSRSLTVAADLVPEITSELELSDEVEDRALEFAERYDSTDPDGVSLNAAPSTIASGAVYAAGLLHNEKRTQPAIAEVSGVSEPAIREAYLEILDREGIETHRTRRSSQNGESASVFSKVKISLGLGDRDE